MFDRQALPNSPSHRFRKWMLIDGMIRQVRSPMWDDAIVGFSLPGEELNVKSR
jgi:hypothetical protein